MYSTSKNCSNSLYYLFSWTCSSFSVFLILWWRLIYSPPAISLHKSTRRNKKRLYTCFNYLAESWNPKTINNGVLQVVCLCFGFLFFSLYKRACATKLLLVEPTWWGTFSALDIPLLEMRSFYSAAHFPFPISTAFPCTITMQLTSVSAITIANCADLKLARQRSKRNLREQQLDISYVCTLIEIYSGSFFLCQP